MAGRRGRGWFSGWGGGNARKRSRSSPSATSESASAGDDDEVQSQSQFHMSGSQEPTVPSVFPAQVRQPVSMFATGYEPNPSRGVGLGVHASAGPASTSAPAQQSYADMAAELEEYRRAAYSGYQAGQVSAGPVFTGFDQTGMRERLVDPATGIVLGSDQDRARVHPPVLTGEVAAPKQAFTFPTLSRPPKFPSNENKDVTPPTNPTPSAPVQPAYYSYAESDQPNDIPVDRLSFDQVMMLKMHQSMTEQNAKLLDLLGKKDDDSGRGSRDLGGTVHGVALPTIKRLVYVNDLSKDVPAFQQWKWQLAIYLRQRSDHADEILSCIYAAVDATIEHRESPELDDSERETLQVPIMQFRDSLSKKALKDYDKLGRELYALFPQHVQTWAEANAKSRHSSKGTKGSPVVEPVDCFYYISIDMMPSKASEFSDVFDAFLTAGSKPTEKNLVAWMLQWRSQVYLMNADGYNNEDDNQVRLYQMLHTAVYPLIKKTDGTSDMRNWFRDNPMPHKVISFDYLMSYFNKLLALAREFYKTSQAETVNAIGTPGDATGKPAKEPKVKPPKVKDPPPVIPATPDAVLATQTPGKTPDKTVDDKPPGKGGGGKGGAKGAGKGAKTPLTDDERKVLFKEQVAKRKEAGKSPPVCKGFFVEGVCKCFGIYSHKKVDWDGFCEWASKTPCMAETRNKRVCEFMVQTDSKLQKCPFKHKLAEGDVVHYLSAQVAGESEEQVNATSDVTEFLLDFCASTGVTKTLDENNGDCVVKTVHGSKVHNSGTMKLEGVTLPAVAIPNASNIVPGSAFMDAMPEVTAVTIAKPGGDLPVGWTIHTANNGAVPLKTNDLGFPIITEESVRLIREFGDAKKPAVNALVQEPGRFRPWTEMPEKTASTILRALSKSTIAPNGLPSHFWCNSSGFEPPANFNTEVFDIECDLNRNVILITKVDESHAGPANVCRGRVYRVIYDLVETIELQDSGSIEAAPRRGVAFVAFMTVAAVAGLFDGSEIQTQQINLVDSFIKTSDVHALEKENYDLNKDEWTFLDSLNDGSAVIVDDTFSNDVFGDDDVWQDLISGDTLTPETTKRSERSKRRAQMIERIRSSKVAVLKQKYPDMPSYEIKQRVHVEMNHVPQLHGCIVCDEANQYRESHSHAYPTAKALTNTFHFDTLGPVTPEGCDGEKYGFCGIAEKSGYRTVHSTPTKHSGGAAVALENTRALVKENPHAVWTAQDSEYKGVFADAVKALPEFLMNKALEDSTEGSIIQSFPVHHTKVPRYSPHRNGTAERNIKELTKVARVSMTHSSAPGSLWPVALRYSADADNILSGAWNVVNGLPEDHIPFSSNFGPFGSVCTVVREANEKGTKFSPKAQTGFLAGFLYPDIVKVGFYNRQKDKVTYIESQNVIVHPDQKYFDGKKRAKVVFEPPSEEETVDINGDPADIEVIEWVLTSCCAKWRMLQGRHDIDEMKSCESVTCKALGTTCRRKQDPGCEQNVMFLGDPSASDEDFFIDFVPPGSPHEVNKVESVGRRKAMSDEKFLGSETTYKQMFTPAIAKEQDVFDVHNSFDYKQPMLLRDFRKNCPDGVICYLNLILGIKNIEAESFEDKKAKARIVVFKELHAKTGDKVSGVDEDEHLRASNAGGLATRVFTAVELGLGKVLRMGDWRGAYQTAPSRDRKVVVALLPREMWPPDWVATFPDDAQVVCPVLKSLYGRVRAGYDFDHFASEKLQKLGWRPLFDIEEALYIHDVDSEETGASGKPPDGLLRYVDDTIFACDPSTIAAREAETAEIFVQPSLTDPNGDKFVGSVLDYKVIEGPDADGHVVYEVQWSQQELITEMVNDYEALRGEVRERKTPAPASDAHVPRTREQEARDAKNCAPYVFTPGVMTEKCQEFVGSIAYIEQHSRPDITVATHQLQQKTAKWSTEEDALLEFMIGYLKGSVDQKLTGIVSTEDFAKGLVKLVLQTDASHAGDRDDRLSTAGFAIYLVGPKTRILVAWGSKRLSAVALSSCESELFGIQHGSKQAIYVKLLVDALCGHITSVMPQFGAYDVNDATTGIKEELEVDAMAAIKAVQNGASTKLRHVRRTLGISLAWCHKKWCNREGSKMTHKKGTGLSADSQTKNLSRTTLETMRKLLGLRGDGGSYADD